MKNLRIFVEALRAASAAHHKYEEVTGQADEEWEHFYAGFIVGYLENYGYRIVRGGDSDG